MRQIEYVACVYSGVQEGRAKGGVAILLSERFDSFSKEWKCVDERIVQIQLRIEGVWVTVVQVYAPTKDRSQDVNDEFYVNPHHSWSTSGPSSFHHSYINLFVVLSLLISSSLHIQFSSLLLIKSKKTSCPSRCLISSFLIQPFWSPPVFFSAHSFG